MLQLKNYRGVMFDCTLKIDTNFEGKLACASKNLQGIYVSWQLIMMQKLNRNQLVSSKLTWGIWKILTRALKDLKNMPFNRLLLTKVNNAWSTKNIKELFFIELSIDAKFEGKITCAFKNDMRKFSNFNQCMFGSLKIVTLMRFFYRK